MTGCLGWKLGMCAVSVSLCWSLKGQPGQDAFHRAGGLPVSPQTVAGDYCRAEERAPGLRPGFGLDRGHRLLGPDA